MLPLIVPVLSKHRGFTKAVLSKPFHHVSLPVKKNSEHKNPINIFKQIIQM